MSISTLRLWPPIDTRRTPGSEPRARAEPQEKPALEPLKRITLSLHERKRMDDPRQAIVVPQVKERRLGDLDSRSGSTGYGGQSAEPVTVRQVLSRT